MDCSLAGAMGLPDEQSDVAVAFAGEQIGKFEVWVPALWWYEIMNVLVSAQKRGRLTENTLTGLVTLYSQLPIQIDFSGDVAILFRLNHIASAYHLSAYDAAYLELAERRQCGIATLDIRLRDTAKRIGIPVFKT